MLIIATRSVIYYILYYRLE